MAAGQRDGRQAEDNGAKEDQRGGDISCLAEGHAREMRDAAGVGVAPAHDDADGQKRQRGNGAGKPGPQGLIAGRLNGKTRKRQQSGPDDDVQHQAGAANDAKAL